MNLKHVLVGLALFTPFVPALAQSQPASRSITVTGDAEVLVAPDEALVTLGVESVNKDLATAKKQNDQAVQKVLASVGKNGVQAADVKTDFSQIVPRYDPNAQSPTVTGFAVIKSISVKVRDLKKLEAVVTDALLAGANTLSGVNFQTSKLKQYRDQARLLAIKAAKDKAVAMAGALEQQIGEPLNILEQSGVVQPYAFNAQNVAPGGINSAVGGTFAPGQISVSASITVTFALK